jgi:hypothetical protein
VPVLVVLPDYSLVRDLGRESFVARDKHGAVHIDAVETHRGPRRLLFVVETGKQLSPEARKVEAEAISEILKRGSAEDRFALLTSRGPRRELHFGASKEKLAEAIHEIEVDTGGKNQDGGIRDTILEAIREFQPGQDGDAIVAVTTGIEKDSNASYQKVRESLIKAHIRLFGVQIGAYFAGYFGTGMVGSRYLSSWTASNQESLFALTEQTGGFVIWENTEGPLKEYRLTEERLHAVRYMSSQLYKAVSEYYGVNLKHPPDGLVLDLVDDIRKDLPKAKVIYQTKLPDCTIPSLPSQIIPPTIGAKQR